MRYQNYNTDLNLVVPLQDNGVFLGSLSGVASFTVVLSAGNNNGITVNYDGSRITSPEGVLASVVGGSLHVYINAQAVEASLGTGVVTADMLINFYDDEYDDGIRTYCMTQSMMVMLVDGDIPEDGSQPVVPQSIGMLTLTMNGVSIGSYNGTPTTIDIPAYEGGGTVLVDNDTIVSENNVLRVANGIKGLSFEYDSAGHSINLAQGDYSYSEIIPYASPTNGGLVNTYVQTFSGRKNFNSGISIGDCVLTWDTASNSLILSNAVTGDVVNLKMSGTIVQNYSAPVLQLLPLDESLSTDATTEVTTTVIVKADNIADGATINLSLEGDTTGFSVSPTSVTGAAAKSAQGASVTFRFNPALIDQTALMGDTVELWTVVNASVTGGVTASVGIQTTVDLSAS